MERAVGRRGLDHAHVALAAGFRVGVVSAHMHAGDRLQQRGEIQEFFDDPAVLLSRSHCKQGRSEWASPAVR
jgi:hypothetical protein